MPAARDRLPGDLTHPAPTLVVGPAWVGDMVMAQSLLKHLKAQRPEAAIDVLAPAWTRPLLERMAEVRAPIEMPLGHGQLALVARYRLGRALRGQTYARAIVLPNSWKSALLPFWAHIPRRTGFRGEMRFGLLNDIRALDRVRLPMTVQRFLSLGVEDGAGLPAPLPAPSLRIDPELADRARRRLGLEPGEAPVLALCPGAEYGPAKRWPTSHFAELARRKLADGWQVWLFGSERDAGPGREIAALLDGKACVDLTGNTSLGEAVDLMSLVNVVVTNDSGLMHVAAALGRPLVAVYGSSDPGFTPPLDPRARVVRLGLECSPCFQRECPLGHYRCLLELEPARVLEAMEALAR
jgi:heptosyltransferase-2